MDLDPGDTEESPLCEAGHPSAPGHAGAVAGVGHVLLMITGIGDGHEVASRVKQT